jgi:hypothetical protein
MHLYRALTHTRNAGREEIFRLVLTFVTTLPAPITHPAPILTPQSTNTPAAIQQLSPISMSDAIEGEPIADMRSSASAKWLQLASCL